MFSRRCVFGSAKSLCASLQLVRDCDHGWLAVCTDKVKDNIKGQELRSKATDRSVRPTRAKFHARLTTEDNLGMEQRAGHAGGDGEEVALAGEDFDLAGAG